MLDAIKPLLDNGIINEDTREAIAEAWEARVTEAKEQEIWTTRIELLQMFDPGTIVDRYVSREWLKKNVMRFQ